MKAIKQVVSKRNVLLIIFIIFGLVLRFNFSSLAYRELVFDMKSYVGLAKRVIDEFFVADCCSKNTGYPLFLALAFRLWGGINLEIVRMIQVGMDVAAGLLIYVTTKRLLSAKASIIFLILYMINPYTSAMTGLILPDSITIFYLALLVWVIGLKSFAVKPSLWFLSGIILGTMLLTRVQYLYLFIFLVAAFVWFIIDKERRFVYLVAHLAGFMIPSIYTLVSNYREHQIVSLMPPYTFQAGHLYLMFYQIVPYPEVVYNPEHPEESRVWMEFALTPLESKNAFSEKYYALFWQKLQTEWPLFFYNWARKAWWLWDKEHVFIYHDPYYPSDRWPLRILNSALFLSAGMGIYKYISANGNRALQNPVILLTVILFTQITFLYSLVSSEARHSLIFYPLLMLWAAYGISLINSKSQIPSRKYSGQANSK